MDEIEAEILIKGVIGLKDSEIKPKLEFLRAIFIKIALAGYIVKIAKYRDEEAVQMVMEDLGYIYLNKLLETQR